ncbi:flaF protein [Roseivivax halodurans JCM 10272]|uniref:FlaF protein n=1 Tax=Roseivivax halodurans JCM 10272 TaxID=1449350 RepID=X7EKA8_9RHOB|nr:flagellar biosynthesis regulator FlaF [Roseivivax halodurans]ETX16310.1 flaF protein [Roseivivax halodurans JCM 10272]
MSIAAYKQNVRETETPRQIERRVLSGVTAAIERAAGVYDTAERTERLPILAAGLRDAISDNQRFWLAIRHDLSEPDNALPKELRAQLISIAHWIDRQSSRVMGGEAGVKALVDINHTIIRGLAGQAPGPSGV